MELAKRLLKKWTIEATLCYLNGCRCSKCQTIRYCETLTAQTCKMKEIVIELVKLHGKPPAQIVETTKEKLKGTYNG